MHTIIINVGAPQEQWRPQRHESAGRSDFWKQRWIYLGGSLGFGDYYYYDDYDEEIGTNVAAAFVADFPLLSPIMSLEAGAVIGNVHYGLSAMGRVGFISEYFEITNDWGVILGSMSVMVGGTIGFKAGPGMLFFRFNVGDTAESGEVVTISAGYKVGVGRVRR